MRFLGWFLCCFPYAMKDDLKHPDYLASVEKYEEYIQDFLKGIDGYGIRHYTAGNAKGWRPFEGHPVDPAYDEECEYFDGNVPGSQLIARYYQEILEKPRSKA